MPEPWSTHTEQWEVVCQILPQGWREKARELRAMRRRRGEIQEPETLLRILMIHLLDGCSLRETATRAAQGELAHVSDVALLKRLRACGEWFRWMGAELMRQHVNAAHAGLADEHVVRFLGQHESAGAGERIESRFGKALQLEFSVTIGEIREHEE